MKSKSPKAAMMPPRTLAVGGSKTLKEDDREPFKLAQSKVAAVAAVLGNIAFEEVRLSIEKQRVAEQLQTAQNDLNTLAKSAIRAIGEDPEQGQWNVDFTAHTVTRQS